MFTHLVLNPESKQHIVEFSTQRCSSVRFRDFNEVQQEREGLTVVLEMYRPSTDGAVIRRGPSVGRKVKFTGMLAQEVTNQIATLLEGDLDITASSVGRREFEFGPASGEKLTEFSIGQDVGRAGALSNPLDKKRACLSGGKDTIGNMNRSLALASERGENRATDRGIRVIACVPNSLCTPALDCVGFEISCRGTILLIQKAADTTSRIFAGASATLEKVGTAAIEDLELDVVLEEKVYRRPPAAFESC